MVPQLLWPKHPTPSPLSVARGYPTDLGSKLEKGRFEVRLLSHGTETVPEPHRFQSQRSRLWLEQSCVKVETVVQRREPILHPVGEPCILRKKRPGRYDQPKLSTPCDEQIEMERQRQREPVCQSETGAQANVCVRKRERKGGRGQE